MRIRVITPPAPIVTPGDVPGSHAANDATVAAKIAAATAEIDGPLGWLGRSLGPQTLELVGTAEEWFDACEIIHLPCPPVIGLTSIKFLDSDRVEETVDPSTYVAVEGTVFLAAAKSWPTTGRFPDAVRIRYQAGYNGTAVADGGTGPIPEAAKQAIIRLAQHKIQLASTDSLLRSETVEGVGSTSYTTPGQVTASVQFEVEHLLSGLRIWA